MPFLSGGHFLTCSHCKLRPNTKGPAVPCKAKVQALHHRCGARFPSWILRVRVSHTALEWCGARWSAGIRTRGVPFSFMPLLRLKHCHPCDVPNGIPFGRSPLLPVGTVNSVQTLERCGAHFSTEMCSSRRDCMSRLCSSA
jgi:hypothetical protein